ncbi:uncharacterized protein LOC127957081 [Carassius gibelio]|uniref:uncharacterized protein LOC127957081 n=1 Tax=Carassius gibelio TaxID=101364 RepID=UPI00227751FA|nr:uncharacterized protein LOC127957081 [Carassius gibelio]
MGLRGLSSTGVFLTVCLLWVTGCYTQKVYFDCGARVDVVDVQGLVLSPGFPYNYSSGTHCVWQFFVPVGHQLIMEMFDFDVFESHDSAVVDEVPNNGGTLASKSLGSPKEPQSTLREDVKQVVIQEQSTKMEMTKVSNSDKMLSDAQASLPVENRNSISSQASRSSVDFISSSPRMATEAGDTVIPETQSPLFDACPHDVLYISDLITFSSRFCGSRRPSSSQLVFGSDDDIVEVIMELITTTHWGRGFALLFHYQNQSQAATTERQRSLLTSDSRTGVVLLGAVSGTVVFAVALAGILCVIFRPKLCAKRANASSSVSSEVPEGVLNSAADVSELQMVSPNHLEQQLRTVNDNNNLPLNRRLSHTGSSVKGACDMSEKAALEQFSSGLTELELGTDEVFVIASAPISAHLPFSPHTQRERFLRHSDTGPSRPFDWSTPDQTSTSVTKSSQVGSTNSTRPRAWSVRTFQDLLPPLPQLHKKWCSWNSTSPFTKLVDSGLPSTAKVSGRGKVLSDAPLHSPADSCQSDSFTSNASYPLTEPAQRQRRLNSTINLRRSRFNAPCFGLLSGTSESSKAQANGITTPNMLSDTSQLQVKGQLSSVEDDHVTVPVFSISEEEDREPLVSEEHPEKLLQMNGQMFEGTKMPLLSKSQAPSIQPSSLVRGGRCGASETQDPSALSC